MQTEDVRSLLQGRLPDTQVKVEGEGCNFQLNLISGRLTGQSPVKRQQQVYAHLNTWIADGSVHTVTTKFFSHTAWAERS